MQPAHFDEITNLLLPPESLGESQCASIPSFQGVAKGGSCDGATVTVVAWKPSPAELAELAKGSSVFITFMGGVPPHFLTTSFKQATNIA
jgi:hypothetical protein